MNAMVTRQGRWRHKAEVTSLLRPSSPQSAPWDLPHPLFSLLVQAKLCGPGNQNENSQRVRGVRNLFIHFNETSATEWITATG